MKFTSPLTIFTLALLLACQASAEETWWDRATNFLRGSGGSSNKSPNEFPSNTISEHELHRLLNFKCKRTPDCPDVVCAKGVGHPPCPDLVCYNDRCVPEESRINGVPAGELVAKGGKRPFKVDRTGVKCKDTSQCPVINCIRAPCPVNECQKGECLAVLYDDTPEEKVEVPCGPNVCTSGQQCCNESCGYCVEPGGFCTKEMCAGESCGPNTCPFGQVCCNASCGMCTPPGGMCTQQVCDFSYTKCNQDSDCTTKYEPYCVEGMCTKEQPVEFECKDRWGCPQARCQLNYPCFESECIDNQCVSKPIIYDDEGGARDVECGVEGLECPALACIREPCPQMVCEDYACVTENPKCSQDSDCTTKYEPYCVEGMCTKEKPVEYECKDRWGCPQPRCQLNYPCFESECIDKQCVSKPIIYDDEGGARDVECGVEGLECPAITCIQAPCPQMVCKDYACVIENPQK